MPRKAKEGIGMQADIDQRCRRSTTIVPPEQLWSFHAPHPAIPARRAGPTSPQGEVIRYFGRTDRA